MRGALLIAILFFAATSSNGAAPVVAGRGDHTLVLKSDGGLVGWGRDSGGQLATGRTLYSATPRAVENLPAIQSVSSYTEHVLALDTQGNVWAWGSNKFGQLGRRAQRNAALPDRVQGISDVAAVTTTSTFSVALKRDGTVWVWGGGSYGEINFPITPDPVQIAGLTDVVEVSGGLQHVLARKRDGTVMGFGLNLLGELGNGTFASSMMPSQVRGLSNVVAVASGSNGSIALTSDGRVWGWGRLTGNYLLPGNPNPRQLAALPAKAAQITCGLNAYAVLEDESVWRLADDLAAPERIEGLIGIRTLDVANGVFESLVGVTRDATLVTVSSNKYGQAGVGTTTPLDNVATYAPLSRVVKAAIGQDVVLAVTSDGKLWVWGRDIEGALGLGSTILYSAPIGIAGLPAITKVAASMEASIALDVNGHVWAWGTVDNGSTGLGTPTPNSRPQQVPIEGVVDIAAGWDHFLFLKADGMVWRAGFLPPAFDYSPVPVPGLPPIVKLAGGWFTAFFIDSQGALYAMGENSSGQLGDGTLQNRESPVRINAISEPVLQVAADFRVSLAVTSSGAVYEWGDLRGYATAYFQTTPVATPQRNAALSNVVELAVAQSHFLARLADGRLMSWGGTNPEVNGRDGPDYPPALVADLDSVISIAVNTQGSYAVRSDGTVWGWGPNAVTNSLVGDGSFTLRPRPVVVLREDGGGSLDAQNWFLDAKPGIAKRIPSNKIPALVATTSATYLSAIANVDANVKFRAQDVGKGIRIFAYAPSGLVKASKDGSECVLAQLNSSGLQQVSASNLQLAGNVAASQQAVLTILNNIPTSQIAGATFCIGSGQTGAQAVDAVNSQCVVTAPGPQTCPAPQVQVVANVAGALSGLWWNPAESGWGIHFTQRRNIVFAAWYTYDATGNPKWYVASNCAMPVGATGTTGTCSGSLYEVSGPTFFGAPFNAALVNVASAGNLQVSFQGANSGSMTYTLGGITRTVPISRQTVGSGASVPPVDYTDLWWNPGESGWGMAVTHQFTNIFLAWYVYDSAGRPVWYVASNCTMSGSGCTGALYRTTGPAFGPLFDPSRVQVFSAGTVSLSFTDSNNGTLSYTVNGVTGTKSVTRQIF